MTNAPQLVYGGNGVEAQVCDSEAGSPLTLHSGLLPRGFAPAPGVRCVPQGTKVGRTISWHQWTRYRGPRSHPTHHPHWGSCR